MINQGSDRMNIEKHEVKGVAIAEVVSDKVLVKTPQDAIDLMGNLYFQGFDKIILQEKQLTPEFFDLKNGMAGEVLQKFSNYRMKLTIVGNFDQYASKSLQDFIRESNKGNLVNFVETTALALG